MPENRFFLNKPLQNGISVELEDEEFHHLKVMRCSIGDQVELVNGKNQLGVAQVTQLDKHKAILHIIELQEHPTPKRKIILALSYLRPKNLDLVIEKGTELGATAFWLFPGQRSEKDSLTPNQLERLQHLAISALKQCGRLDLPEIIQMPELKSWKTPPPGELYWGDPKSTTPFKPTTATTFFIGPEKGFSKEEENILQSTFHAKGITLNPNVLRAETAALCAIALAAY